MVQRLVCFVLLFVTTLVPAKALDHFIYAADINENVVLLELYRFSDNSFIGRMKTDGDIWALEGNNDKANQSAISDIGLGSGYATWQFSELPDGNIDAKRKYFYKEEITNIVFRLVAKEAIADINRKDFIKLLKQKGFNYFDELSDKYQVILAKFNYDERVIYKGTIGYSPIIMELSFRPDKVVKGRYFYEKSGIDIPLQGDINSIAEPYPLKDHPYQQYVESSTNGPVFTYPNAHFSGIFVEKNYDGLWELYAKKMAMKFSLKEVDRYSGEHSYSQSNGEFSPYDTLKLQGHAKETGKIRQQNGTSWQYVKDPRNNITFFKLVDFPNKAIKNTVNQQLQTQFWQLSQSAFECLSTQYITTQVGTGWTGFAEQSVSVLYTSKNLLVYEQSIDAYCGGAHPSIYTQQTAIDMTTAKELDWQKIFNFAKIYGDKTDNSYNLPTRVRTY
ncbi:hypothetical protein N5853_13155 [Bartonella sp. HY329]|uniref:hypothetical protein n=1 Tax=unclassified Bartonella TaxID=2645622 RepID=UPI0021C9FD42|nr:MULTISPECIES: hypothetical protein [unclassified Bartonella]UXM95014.1 hypothetical protein N5853_13155 [Bartonella sp. HY329]UXN09337.1 hypothetical protein N5852_13165 [Bartonella sp. HY328]